MACSKSRFSHQVCPNGSQEGSYVPEADDSNAATTVTMIFRVLRELHPQCVEMCCSQVIVIVLGFVGLIFGGLIYLYFEAKKQVSKTHTRQIHTVRNNEPHERADIP